jgi:copper chaperone
MCTEHQHGERHKAGHVHEPNAQVLRVEDMTCGHCAATITRAIETSMPGTKVHADPDSKLVKITGSADIARLQEIVKEAGYTPTLEQAHA